MANNDAVKKINKLSDGPCSREYQSLEDCAERKKNRQHQRQQQQQGMLLSNTITTNNDDDANKDKMQSCPSETDRLIKCIRKNPLYFQ